MRIAILADVHANLPALEAVVRDIQSEGAECLWYLGDAVGYGAQPFECLQVLFDHDAVMVTGNHEQAVCNPAITQRFNLAASEAILWTRKTLSPATSLGIGNLPLNFSPMEGVLLFHGLPDDTAGYIRTTQTAAMILDHLSHQDPGVRISFFGHTHRPRIFERIGGRPVRMLDMGPDLITVTGRRYLINPGSVGQPRDGDPRAHYILFETDNGRIRFKRIEYDVPSAQERIIKAGLPAALAARLARGR